MQCGNICMTKRNLAFTSKKTMVYILTYLAFQQNTTHDVQKANLTKRWTKMFPLALGWKITLSFFLSLTSFSPSPLITLDTISYQQCHIIYISLGQKCLIKHGNSSVPNTDYKFNEAAYLWHQGHRENPSNSRSASWRQRSTKKKRKKTNNSKTTYAVISLML